ncbi:hypothetical protein, partial [Gordonia aichiensis]
PGDRAWAQLASFQAARQGKPDQMSPTRAPAPERHVTVLDASALLALLNDEPAPILYRRY